MKAYWIEWVFYIWNSGIAYLKRSFTLSGSRGGSLREKKKKRMRKGTETSLNTVRSFDEGTIGPKQWKGQWKSPHRKRTGRWSGKSI